MTQQNSFNKIDSLYSFIDRGRLGLNIGLPTGIEKLDKIIAGVQRQTMTLIGGTTGSGKSTFAMYSYIYYPLVYGGMLGSEKYKVIYYSLEMTAEVLYAKLLSMYISDHYSVDLTYSQILSREEVLADEYYEIVLDAKEWLEQVQKHITIYDKTLTTVSLFKHLHDYATRNGTFNEGLDGSTRTYTSNIPDQYVMTILDHMGLMRPMPGQSKKDAMDGAANILIDFRNVCAYSPIPIMQLNRSGSSMDRRNEGMQEPELQDFKGTGDVGEAAEVVLALFHPHREKMDGWKGYDLRVLRDRFRAIFCLKNRFGTADQAVPVSFFGNVGIFKSIPKPSEIANDYTPYLSLRPCKKEEVVEDAKESVIQGVKTELNKVMFTL